MDNKTLSCRTCDVTFDTLQEQRQHFKSEWHVYKLRCKVAPEGKVITPPNEPSQPEKGKKPVAPVSSSEDEDALSDDSDLGEESESGNGFVPEKCLFCNEVQDTFTANVAHMQKSHSFIVPYQSSLSVELETLVWYLHLVIHSYRECILCAKRYRSEEAVQQHMTAKGHCRLELGSDIAEFYDSSQLSPDTLQDLVNPDEASMRLPSGKLLTHRSHVHVPAGPRAPKRSDSQETPHLPSSSSRPTQGSTELLDAKDKKEASFATQLAKLSANDQRSLMHLPASEQRSALATVKRQLSQAQRAERRAQLKLERKGNKTLMKNFSPDTSGTLGGKNPLFVMLWG